MNLIEIIGRHARFEDGNFVVIPKEISFIQCVVEAGNEYRVCAYDMQLTDHPNAKKERVKIGCDRSDFNAALLRLTGALLAEAAKA